MNDESLPVYWYFVQSRIRKTSRSRERGWKIDPTPVNWTLSSSELPPAPSTWASMPLNYSSTYKGHTVANHCIYRLNTWPNYLYHRTLKPSKHLLAIFRTMNIHLLALTPRLLVHKDEDAKIELELESQYTRNFLGIQVLMRIFLHHISHSAGAADNHTGVFG